MSQIQTEDIQKIMKLYARLDKPLEIKVDGTSMLPLIKPGEVVSVKKKDKYKVGDILVFKHYKDNLTIHRLLKINGNNYICKGDNSYNLEHITYSEIIGKIDIKHNSYIFIRKMMIYLICIISYRIGVLSLKSHYNIPSIYNNNIYKIYHKYYISGKYIRKILKY